MRILVVGGGIGGLASAIALRRAGFDVSVVERSPGLAPEGFSITIPSNGTRALDALGVLDQVERKAVVVERFEYVWNDDVVLSAPLDDGFGGWPWLALLRSHLLGALAAAAGDVRFDSSVSSISEDAGGVAVTFQDGTVERFEVVVGADGIHSSVRAAVAGAALPEWAGLLYYRALIEDPDWPPVMRGYLGDGRLFGLFPGGPGRVYGWAAVATSDPTADPVAGRRSRLLAEFSSMGDEPRQFLERTISDEDFSCTPPMWVRSDRWHTSRVVLIGDAAHGCPPFMAEGACLAMEDALVLADCLTSLPLDAAFDAYTARRAPRAAHVHDRVSNATMMTAAGAAQRAERMRSAEGPALMRIQFGPLLEPI